MATMGKRKIAAGGRLVGEGRRTSEERQPAVSPGATLVAPASVYHLVGGAVHIGEIGRPIMREDFITETGFLPNQRAR